MVWSVCIIARRDGHPCSLLTYFVLTYLFRDIFWWKCSVLYGVSRGKVLSINKHFYSARLWRWNLLMGFPGTVYSMPQWMDVSKQGWNWECQMPTSMYASSQKCVNWQYLHVGQHFYLWIALIHVHLERMLVKSVVQTQHIHVFICLIVCFSLPLGLLFNRKAVRLYSLSSRPCLPKNRHKSNCDLFTRNIFSWITNSMSSPN